MSHKPGALHRFGVDTFLVGKGIALDVKDEGLVFLDDRVGAEISVRTLVTSPQSFWSGGSATEPVEFHGGFKVTSLNDQHLHLSLPDNSPLRIGDMVGFGVSHPCLTFDKWRVIHLVDRAYRVNRSIRTFF